MLLPFAVQFIHSFEKHEHICNVNDIHIDEHELDCSVFHFRINQNSIDFSSDVVFLESNIANNVIFHSEAQLSSFQYFNKSSRAPPTLLF